ncbi:hypothetical protein JHY03_49580 [Streptomyces sp. CA-256286]|nr:hypothetical protein JHY03_49580 [Streptomyces sp. CA-256286]
MTPELQLQPDALLPDMAVILHQPRTHGSRPLAGALGQRLPPPQVLGGPQQPDRPIRPALLRRHGGLGAEPLETDQIQVVLVAHPELVQPGRYPVQPDERAHGVAQMAAQP